MARPNRGRLRELRYFDVPFLVSFTRETRQIIRKAAGVSSVLNIGTGGKTGGGEG